MFQFWLSCLLREFFARYILAGCAECTPYFQNLIDLIMVGRTRLKQLIGGKGSIEIIVLLNKMQFDYLFCTDNI